METKKNINIWKSLQKVPAGTMFVPLIIGAIITTICQGIFNFHQRKMVYILQYIHLSLVMEQPALMM